MFSCDRCCSYPQSLKLVGSIFNLILKVDLCCYCRKSFSLWHRTLCAQRWSRKSLSQVCSNLWLQNNSSSWRTYHMSRCPHPQVHLLGVAGTGGDRTVTGLQQNTWCHIENDFLIEKIKKCIVSIKKKKTGKKCGFLSSLSSVSSGRRCENMWNKWK